MSKIVDTTMLKTIWSQDHNGAYGIAGVTSIALSLENSAASDFYKIDDEVQVVQPNHIGTKMQMLGQSIVPIVMINNAGRAVSCIGTGFFISCSGLLVTAAHVMTHPIELNDGSMKRMSEGIWRPHGVQVGVMIPQNPFVDGEGHIFRPVEWAFFLAKRSDVPLPFADNNLKLSSDVAVCKVQLVASDVPHQPLSVIQPGIKGIGSFENKTNFSIGYAEMRDSNLEWLDDGTFIGDFNFELYVSVGKIVERFPLNSSKPQAKTPGPCFSISAKYPGGMSGSPIFDAEGIYVHGVVSSGLVDQDGPTNFGYGSMLAPSLILPLKQLDGSSIVDLLSSLDHGMAQLGIPDA